MRQIEIVANTSKYDTDDLHAWIDEVEWYVEKLVSYARERDHQSEPRAEPLHLKVGNYASHSTEYRFKYEYTELYVQCPRGSETQLCGCMFRQIKLINPERLVDDSAMARLTSGLSGDEQRADLDLLVDVAHYLARQRQWGTGQHGAFKSAWGGARFSSDESFVTLIPTHLHRHGLGVGTRGKSIWDVDKAKALQPIILQELVPHLSRACQTDTRSVLERASYEVMALVDAYQQMRESHRLNSTTSSLTYEDELKKKLQDWKLLLEGVN